MIWWALVHLVQMFGTPGKFSLLTDPHLVQMFGTPGKFSLLTDPHLVQMFGTPGKFSLLTDPHLVQMFRTPGKFPLPGNLLPIPKEAIADLSPIHLLFGWWRFPVQCYQILKGACSWQATIATRYGTYPDHLLVDNMVYMGTVNNNGMCWYVCSGQHGVHGYSQQ